MRVALERVRMIMRTQAGILALLAAIGLSVIGIAAIGTVPASTHAPIDYAAKQTTWLALGLLVMSACVLPRPKTLGDAAYPVFAVTLVILALIIMPFMPRSIVPVINGARSWINLGFMNAQPSELAKVSFILALAWYMRHRASYRTLRGLLVPFAIMFVPVLLIVKQPDMGTAILFAPTLFFMLIAAGAKLRHIGALVGLGLVVLVVNIGVVLWAPDHMQVLADHHVARIRSTVRLARGETTDLSGTDYQQYKAMSLLGAGGVQGYGARRSSVLLRFNAMPESHNDMIFAVIINRWGLFGGMVTLGLFVVLILSLLAVASRSKDPFGRLMVVGFAGLLCSQMVINVGMNLGLLPIIGITLPLVSYGGSSLLATYAMIGLTLNIATARPGIITRPSFEFDEADAVAE